MSIRVVDLFCGIGGLTHGLSLAGLDVAAGVDIDISCRFPYEKNNNAVFIEGDVAQISPEVISRYFQAANISVLVGCAPCQPFSKYTHRYRKKGSNYGKWRLLHSFAEKIEDVLPDIISMENVPQIIRENVFSDFLCTLDQLGYSTSYSIVFCPDYGVPQSRKRLVLLASRFGNISIIGPEYTPRNYITVRQAIGNLPRLYDGQFSPDDPLHFCSKLSKINLKRIQNSRQGGSWREWDKSLQLKCHKKKSGKTYGSVYGRMIWDMPSPTITTQFYGYGNGRFGHPEQDRALSIREGAILQSFPPSYCFTPNDVTINKRAIATHIGNAVPVQLGRAIGVSIINHIMEVKGHD